MAVRLKIFLDSSVLVTALLSQQGGSFYILTNLANTYQFLLNDYVIDELLEVIDRKFPVRRHELKSSLFVLLEHAQVIVLRNPPRSEIRKLEKLINQEDAPILAGAINTANYLLTLDQDFLDAQVTDFAKAKGLTILKPEHFIALIRQK